MTLPVLPSAPFSPRPPVTQAEWDLALQLCAQEKIHLISQVQGGYALVAMDLALDRFAYLSENSEELLGTAIEELWAIPPSELFGATQLLGLSRRVQSYPTRGARLVDLRLPGEAPRLAWCHFSGDLLVLEISLPQLEKSGGPARTSSWEWEDTMRLSLSRMEYAATLEAKLETVVVEVARLGEFDRVMVYQFLADGAGEVVAETARPGMDAYLGLRYPASDIPAQARDLFMRNEIRLIRDVGAAPVALLASPAAPGRVLDLSLSRCRQPAAVHLEYLRNMGVTGSFVCAVLVDGRLWGLVSCHHEEALMLDCAAQVRLGALTAHLGSNLAGMARELRLRSELECARIASKLIQCIAITDDWTAVLMSMAGELCKVLGADGLSLHFDDRWHSHGLVAGEAAAGRLVARGIDLGGGVPFPSVRTPEDAAYDDLDAEIGGFLVIPLSYFQDDALVLYRREQTLEVRWAGNPTKTLERSEGVARLRPRESFAAWKETHRGTCTPWLEEDLAVAAEVRSTLSDIVITAHYFRQALESPHTARLRLAHETDPEPVVIADENGIIVYQNAAAHWDPLLAQLQSLDLMARRMEDYQGEHLAQSFHALVHEGESIRALIQHGAAGTRWLEGARLLEHGRLAGYSVRLTAQESAGNVQR